MREGVGHAWQVTFEQRADAELMGGVHDRPEEVDADRLDLPLLEILDDLDHAALVQRPGHGAVIGHALRHLVGERARHVGLGVGHGEVEGLGAAALAEHQHVRVAPGGEKGGPCGVAGDDRVNRMGGAVDQHLAPAEQGLAALAQVVCRTGEGFQHTGDRVRRRRWRLVHAQAPVVGFDDEVGKGSPGIDRESHGSPAVSDASPTRRPRPPGGPDPSPNRYATPRHVPEAARYRVRHTGWAGTQARSARGALAGGKFRGRRSR